MLRVHPFLRHLCIRGKGIPFPMDKKVLVLILAVLAVVAVAAIAFSGGSEDKKEEQAQYTGILLDKNNLQLFPTGSVKLTAKLSPEGYAGKVVWSSSNESAATVDQEGRVTYRGVGVASIKATCEGKSAESYVTCAVAMEDPLPLSDGYAQTWGVRYLSQYPLSEAMLKLLLERYGFSEESVEFALKSCGPGYTVPDWYDQAAKACGLAKATGMYDKDGAAKWLRGEGFTEDQASKAAAAVYA